MKREALLTWAAIAVLGLVSAGLGWWLGQRVMLPPEQPPPAGLVVVEPGQAVPPMRLPYLSGDGERRLDGPGRPRLINYWASWCGPCRKEMPILDAFAAEQGGNGIQVLGVALDTSDEAKAFLREVPVSFETLIETPGPRDSSVVLGNRRNILPFTALVDAEGRLVRTKYGEFPSLEALNEWVRGPAE